MHPPRPPPLPPAGVWILGLAAILLLFLCHVALHWRDAPFTGPDLAECLESKESVFLLVAVLTAPRPGHPVHLAATLHSLLTELATSTAPHLKARVLVLNHFGPNHTAFAATAALLTHLAPPIDWVTKALPLPPGADHPFHRQRLHAHSLLTEAARYDARYVMLLEDDFPLCPSTWNTILQLLCRCSTEAPESRGLFIGTGGSGAVIRRDHLPALLQALDLGPRLADERWRTRARRCLDGLAARAAHRAAGEKLADMEPWCETHLKHDVILQSFLLERPLCVSAELLLRHVGYASSTVANNGDAASRPDWQCGWRQPLTTAATAVVLEGQPGYLLRPD